MVFLSISRFLYSSELLLEKILRPVFPIFEPGVIPMSPLISANSAMGPFARDPEGPIQNEIGTGEELIALPHAITLSSSTTLPEILT